MQGPFIGTPNGGDVPAGFPKDSGACKVSSVVNDVIDLKVQILVPTNAKGFSFDFNFMSEEWPDFLCSTVQRLVHRLPPVDRVQRRDARQHLVRYEREHDQREQQLLPGVHARRPDRLRLRHEGDLHVHARTPASSPGPASRPRPPPRRTAEGP